MEEQELIRLEKITVKTEGYDALSETTLSFPEGKSTIIMGPSGCGKSTLLKVAAGLVPPDTGKIFYRGENLFGLSERPLREMRRANGFVFQDGALWENKSVFDNLALPLQIHSPEMPRSELERRIVRSLERYDLSSSLSLRPAQLSGGERKIVSFLRALMTEPTIVFLDEPTLSIDFTMADRIGQAIRDCKARGCTILCVTHDARLAATLADHLVVLNAGCLLEAGPFDRVKRTSNPTARTILSEVLGDIASFDSDLLELLGGEDRDEH